MKKFKVYYSRLVDLSCGCCSEYEFEEEFFDSYEEALDFSKDISWWEIYEYNGSEYKLILDGE